MLLGLAGNPLVDLTVLRACYAQTAAWEETGKGTSGEARVGRGAEFALVQGCNNAKTNIALSETLCLWFRATMQQ